MEKDDKILIGVKGEKQHEPLFNWETIEKWWIENGEIKIWKREPFRYKIPKQK
jgi:hypothetical protein